MTARQRQVVFLVAMAGLAALYLAAIGGLPGFGHYPGAYGDVVDSVGVAARKATDVVTAVNFDIRGFDTLGEEFILFAAATGVSVVLRALREEREAPAPVEEAARRRERSRNAAVRVACMCSVGPTVVVGWNIVSHGQVNPGGGFQGGVILATAVLLVYLGGQFLTFRRISPADLLDAAEGAGAAGFALIGVGALAVGSAYLANVLPLGPSRGVVDSSGTIALISFVVGVEVAASMLVIVSELLEQTLLVKP
ncbi:MAG TPA: MnhB domain-containing protein [Acidimicrobiales bacterium]|nr:MnhB domain-containing protein [Acidimicrobiales bacterium]